ncbi:MAG TPA: hypothetical protein VFZ99_08975 [Terriglobales bacterium]
MNQTEWKKILMYVSFGAAGYFLLSGKRPAGMAAAGLGLAALASEHPEKFEKIWNEAPEYLDRGHRIVNGVQSLLERIAQHTATLQSIRGGRQDNTEYRAQNY